MKRRTQAIATTAQEPDGNLHVPGESPYLLTIDAARFLLFDRKHDGTLRSHTEAMRLFREWAERNCVPALRRGRTLLYRQSVLAAFLEQREWTKKHVPTVAAQLATVKSKTPQVNEVPR
jgi:hypothetical protein